MNVIELRTHTGGRWLFAAALFLTLLIAAVVATPEGQALAGRAQVTAQYVYYAYLSLIFKN